VLSEPSDITLKTAGVRYLLIKSETLGKTLEKSVSDTFECRLSKHWIPCEIVALAEDKTQMDIPKIEFKLVKENSFSFRIETNKAKTKDKILFNLEKFKPKFKITTMNGKIQYYNFHKLFSYSNSFAKSIGNVNWLKLEKLERNNIIKSTTCGILQEDSAKAEIRKLIGGF
jgi:hypothetical protein